MQKSIPANIPKDKLTNMHLIIDFFIPSSFSKAISSETRRVEVIFIPRSS